MRVVIDTARCTGHGRCYAVAPDVFDADDEGNGLVRPEADPLPPALEPAARLAEANCPENAITLHP